MHYKIEVILPPIDADKLEQAIESILHPFNENNNHCDGAEFFDYYTIGGRWSGSKLRERLDPAKLEAFHNLLTERKVTVSGFQAGKPTLQPASQRDMVDALWREHFPDSGTDSCPLFDHAPSPDPSDICRLDQLPDGYSASRVVIAGPAHNDGGLTARYMVSRDFWNGVNHVDTTWNGNVSEAVASYEKTLERATTEHHEIMSPKPDWLVVTLDCHS